jgi:hypothetical protein
MRKLLGIVIAAALFVPACADHLPDQDLRILSVTVPGAKLSSEDLWKDFQKDAAAARKQYFGKSIDVSGKIAWFETDATKTPAVFFGEPGKPGVRGRLLDERAAATLKELTIGARVMLRCYCEGLDEKNDVLLKSCIKP